MGPLSIRAYYTLVILVLLNMMYMESSKASMLLGGGGGSRKLSSLYTPPPLILKYHNGPLLTGNLPISLLWYGHFTPTQRTIFLDFFNSLHRNQYTNTKFPSVFKWWSTVEKYSGATALMINSNPLGSVVGVVPLLTSQTLDSAYSLGKSLSRAQIAQLASKHQNGSELTVVFTSFDVIVEGFCMSGCGSHGAELSRKGGVYVWVGDSSVQCPGTCAWPFHQPVYGAQTPPLVAPNGDVGVDGMVINVASMLAAAVTNPYGTGFFQGQASAPLEAASACPGVYGSGAYPGYQGKVLVDPVTGGGFNAVGVNGRKFLLPALWDPQSHTCYTLL